MNRLQDLLTEAPHPQTANIDQLPTLDMMAAINDADATVAAAVREQLEPIARAVDGIVERMEKGGRLFYQGAGTSGRLGVLDASECPPTFNVDSHLVVGIIAGGDTALRYSSELAEDDPAQGARDLERHDFTAKDALVGIAASGRTPYVLGGVEYARSLGALTIGLSCVPGSDLARQAQIAISPAVGPEVLTGSTRMRAGTATKLVLNMLSTGVMIRSGFVYQNLMVNVQPSNAKLQDRAARIIVSITGVDYPRAQALLAEAGAVRTAVVMEKLGLSRSQALERLLAARGSLRRALGEDAAAE